MVSPPATPEFSRAMGQKGWIGITWPKKYGGSEKSFLERYVVTEELRVANAPVGLHFTADRQSGPSILKFGTEAQKQAFLPRIAAVFAAKGVEVRGCPRTLARWPRPDARTGRWCRFRQAARHGSPAR